MRTRMSGGVAGASGRPLPLCRLPGNASLPIGDSQTSNREIGVPGAQPARFAPDNLLLAGSAGRRALFARGADGFVVAEPACKSRFCGKLSRAHIGGGFLDFRAHFFELL